MLEKTNDNRTLPEVFKELQDIRNAQEKRYIENKNSKNVIKSTINKLATKTTGVACIIVLVFSIMYEPMKGENNPPKIVNMLYKLTFSVVFLSSIIVKPYVCLPSQ